MNAVGRDEGQKSEKKGKEFHGGVVEEESVLDSVGYKTAEFEI